MGFIKALLFKKIATESKAGKIASIVMCIAGLLTLIAGFFYERWINNLREEYGYDLFQSDWPYLLWAFILIGMGAIFYEIYMIKSEIKILKDKLEEITK